MPRPIEALIDKHALQHNIALLREKAGKRLCGLSSRLMRTVMDFMVS